MTALPSTELAVADQTPPEAVWHGFRRILSGTAADRPSEIPDLDRRVDDLLKVRLKHLKLPPDIDALFQDKTRKGTRKMMASWCAWVGWLNLPSFAFDLLIQPAGTLPVIIAFRVVITVLFLTSSLLLRDGMLVGTEHVAAMVPCFVTMALAGIAGIVSPGHALLEHYTVNAIVVVASGIMFIRINQAHSTLLAAGSMVIMLGAYADSGTADLALKLQTLAFYAVILVALLHAKRVQTLYQYRLFLVKTRDELRSTAATKRSDELSSIAYIDPLTGVPNRRYFEEICASIGDTTKNLLPLSLCVIDVDHFKNLNDKLGHLQGDRCLRVIATAIRNNLRGKSDILARYGGEEFVIMLPGTDDNTALDVLERIRIAIMSLNHPNPGTPSEVVTISAGIAVATTRPVTVETLLNDADVALYRAKTSGRNKVCSQIPLV